MIHICPVEVSVVAGIASSAALLYRAAWSKICQFCGRAK